eukprot:s3914_g1.t3
MWASCLVNGAFIFLGTPGHSFPGGSPAHGTMIGCPPFVWRLRWTSQLNGHKLVRNTSDWVVRHTNSRTVVVWLCIDLFISLGLGTYYFLFRYVSSLGWVPLQMMSNFKFYVLIAGIRAACTLWGITSVLRRKVKHVKLYYTVFLLNLLVAVWLMVPILRMDCSSCATNKNYYQCEALQSFARDGVSLNKVPRPQGFPHREVPYAKPPNPKNSQEVAVTKASESVASSSSTTVPSTTATATASPAKEDQQAVDDAKKLAAATQQLGTTPEGGALLDLGPGLLSAEPGRHEAEMLDDLLSSGHPRLVAKKRRRWKAASFLQLEDPQGAAGVLPANGQYQSPAATGQLPQQPLLQQPQVMPFLQPQWANPNQQGVISPNQQGPNSPIPQYQQLVSPTAQVTPTQPQPMVQVLQAQPMQGQPISPYAAAPANQAAIVAQATPVAATTATTTTAVTGTTTKPLARQVSEGDAAETIAESTSVQEAVDLTKKLYDKRCRCDKESCRSYTDHDGYEKGWCFLDEQSVDRCHAERKQVFKDLDTGRLWSRDICHTVAADEHSCQCSGIGMKPTRGASTVDQALLGDKKFKYGSSCEKWNGAATAFKWCYVGWDSPCVDRRKDKTISSSYKEQEIPSQYWSMVASDCDEHGVALRNASDACENLDSVANVVCLMHLFLSLPMVAVLYNFISNRCGDDIKMESQFAIESSSSDEDDNDEFEAGVADDQEDESESAGEDDAVPKFAGEDAAPNLGEDEARGGRGELVLRDVVGEQLLLYRLVQVCHAVMEVDAPVPEEHVQLEVPALAPDVVGDSSAVHTTDAQASKTKRRPAVQRPSPFLQS